MPQITSSLFAHIENDPHLSGTYKLEGHRFSETTEYLKDYLIALNKKEPLSIKYTELLPNLSYLVNIEKEINKASAKCQGSSFSLPHSTIESLAKRVVQNIYSLDLNKYILLPGGWSTKEGGHAMIYQITKIAEGYHFTVFNSGNGIKYHDKYSSQEKELYNPTKTWHIPESISPELTQEFIFFISRLFKALIIELPENQTKPFSAQKLYEETFSSISHICGKEIESPKPPFYHLTAGQLSGTCAQRCLHQMLKINSENAEAYKRFIFKFKHHALTDYAKACIDQKRISLTRAVRKQIHLAIENNLKLLGLPGLFNDTDICQYQNELEHIAQAVDQTDILLNPNYKPAPQPYPLLDIKLTHKTSLNGLSYSSYLGAKTFIPPIIKANPQQNFLEWLSSSVQKLEGILDPAIKYYQLRQLIEQFPASIEGIIIQAPQRSQIKKDVEKILWHLEKQQEEWLKNTQIPSFNVMVISTITLYMDIDNSLCSLDNKPTFKPFVEAALRTVLGNQRRNPFYATNTVSLDKRFRELQERFSHAPKKTHEDFYSYLRELLALEPSLATALEQDYNNEYKMEVSLLHEAIRKHQLGGLYLISQYLKKVRTPLPKYEPLIKIIDSQLKTESILRRALNPFFKIPLSCEQNLYFNIDDKNNFSLYSPLFASFITWQELSMILAKDKYRVIDSSIRKALEADIPEKSDYNSPIKPKSANEIQISNQEQSSGENRRISTNDIVARDYFYLRSNPVIQIDLTLDYFIRHIDKLSDKSNQSYLEANLFQPGLLIDIDTFKKAAFLEQFDLLLKTGCRMFHKNGQYSQDSLFFLHLNYKVSHYLYLCNKETGIPRLLSIEEELRKELLLSHDAQTTYFLQQHLFLVIIARIEWKQPSPEIFKRAFEPYYHIQSHANPFMFEDKSWHVEVDTAKAAFQILTSLQIKPTLEESIRTVLTKTPCTQDISLIGSSAFPVFTLIKKDKKYLTFDILLGQMFSEGLAHTTIPFALRQHPLLAHLGLDHLSQCLMSQDGKRLVLHDKDHEIRLFYDSITLTIEKTWQIEGLRKFYQLYPLTSNHLAHTANSNISVIQAELPSVLKDITIDFWQDVTDSHCGLLVKNNTPIYSVENKRLFALNQSGYKTGYLLSFPKGKTLALINQFEGSSFILLEQKEEHRLISLPRYGLVLENNPKQPEIIHLKHGDETVVDCEPPIHPSVAGLMLENSNHERRLLIPIARFYATNHGAIETDFYPIIHDINGIIAQFLLQEEQKRCPSQHHPLWDYDHSEQYLSFRIQDNTPLPDRLSDALYLAYIYLAIHQPDKAWSLLEDCRTQWGGLRGEPIELQFISWICDDLPTSISSNTNKSSKKTPPYVACKLKALSLVCDFLLQDRCFTLPSVNHQETANAVYNSLQYKQLSHFQELLPHTVSTIFTRYQAMRRHLEHGFTLSTTERTYLLHYYHQSLPKDHKALGSLGYEWLLLNIESLFQEKEALEARVQSDSICDRDKSRLLFIEQRLAELKPVMAKSTELELVSIDLTLPENVILKRGHLSAYATRTLDVLESDQPNPSDPTQRALDEALIVLSSEMTDETFLTHFPIYFNIALRHTNTEELNRLIDYCSKTLIAHRHIPWAVQESNIPLLCNTLYRIAHNQDNLNHWKSSSRNPKLRNIIVTVRGFSVPKLSVYQAKDISKNILATSTKMLPPARPTHPKLNLPILQNTGLLHAPPIKTAFAHHPRQCLDVLILKYKDLHEKHQAITTLNLSEEETGLALFEAEKENTTLAKIILTDPNIQRLMTVLFATKEDLLHISETSWEEALTLANQGPEHLIRKQAWLLEKQAKSRPSLTKRDLQDMYCHADLAYSIEKTALENFQIEALHAMTHKALVDDIRYQLIVKLEDLFEQACKTNNDSLANEFLRLLSLDNLPGLNTPSTVIIQHEEQIILHARQVQAIQALVEHDASKGFKERIEKIIPGGGKSKVILPILAQEKALGDNLVLLEVPSSLLKTNYIDFNRSSYKLFGKTVFCFEFNRDSNCSAESLSRLYQRFINIMTSRSYIVTTSDAMQSLELKYIECLLSKEQSDDWKSKVYWLDKVITLIHDRGDAIIDEVHQNLSIKKKLNYTCGEPIPLNPSLIKHAIALFRFIDLDIIRNGPQYLESYDWSRFKTNLASRLIQDTGSPLYSFVYNSMLQNSEAIQNELICYLAGNSETLPGVILEASFEEKELLAFFKQEITTILPDTLRKKLYVQYGPSKKENLSPIEYTLAIPYSGNNLPNEQSRFGNELVALNLSIQMMLLQGVSEPLFKECLMEWKALARQELFQNPSFQAIENTPTALGFAVLIKEYPLDRINVEDQDLILPLHKRHQYNPMLMFDVLQNRTLKQIKQDAAIIHSDAFNHVDLYRSVQGVSGTVNNHSTFHQRLQYNPQLALGSDDYIIQILLHNKTKLSTVDYQDPTQFLKTALIQANNPRHTRAIIDINATFMGVSNAEVAHWIVDFIKDNTTHFSTPIKHVLFFDANQVLCALDVEQPTPPIVIGTSDAKEIDRLLRSTPDERFTYYDHAHTLGTDLKQDDNAHALVLGDEKDSFQAFVQGIMRMRGLSQKQMLEIILPLRLGSLDLDKLIKILKENDATALSFDTLCAAKGQMKNYIRRQCLSFIQDLDSEKAIEKATLIQQFSSFFIETPSLELFSTYGLPHTTQSTTTILQGYKSQLLDSFRKSYQLTSSISCESIFAKINQELDLIIEHANAHCLPQYRAPKEINDREVQIQKETQTQLEIQHLDLASCYDPTYRAESHKSWNKELETKFKPFLDWWSFDINTICKTVIFSPTLRVSHNFAKTYVGQKEHMNAFLKPVFVTWYHLEDQELYATILTPQEVQFMHLDIEKNWFSTPQGILLSGNRPLAILSSPNYQSLREQILFFNGDLETILTQENPLCWLTKNPVEKIDFFTHHLQMARVSSDKALSQLRMVLTNKTTEGFDYIAKHPFDDYKRFDWKQLFPEAQPMEISTYQNVANAFAHINQHTSQDSLDIGALQRQFNLPLNCLQLIQAHQQHLKSINLMLNRLSDTGDRLFLESLSPEDNQCLETCLKQPLSNFLKSTFTQLDEHYDLRVLMFLLRYPGVKTDDRKKIMTHLFIIASKTHSPDNLSLLLKADPPSDALILKILDNSACNEGVIQAMLEIKHPLQETMLKKIVEKCQSPLLLNTLLQRPDLSDQLLEQLLQREDITPPLFTVILKRMVNLNETQVLTKPSLHFYLLELLREHKQLSTNIVNALLNNLPAIPEDLLIMLAKEIDNITLLQQLLTRLQQVPDEHPLLVEPLLDKLFLQLKTNDTFHLQIEVMITDLLEFINQGKTETSVYLKLMEIIKKHTGVISGQLGITILHSFKGELINYISLEKILPEAHVDDLRRLLDYQATYTLCESKLCQIVLSLAKNPELLESFLLQSKISDTLLNIIIDKSQELILIQSPKCHPDILTAFTRTKLSLKEESMQALEKKCTNPELLDAFIHKQPLSTKVLESLLERDDLLPQQCEYLLGFISEVKNPKHIFKILGIKRTLIFALSTDPALQVVAYQTKQTLTDHFINANFSSHNEEFVELAKETREEGILTMLLKKSTTLSDETIIAIIDNPIFSVEMADTILLSLQRSGDVKKEVFTPLIKKLFEKFAHNPELDWKRELVEALRYFHWDPQSFATMNRELLLFFKENKSLIHPELGKTLLEVFGNSIIQDLPLEIIIESAEKSLLEKMLFFENIPTLEDKILRKYLSKLPTMQLIERFIQHRQINDTALENLMLVRQDLQENQLVSILKKIKNPRALQTVYLYRNSTPGIFEAIAKHPSITTDYLQEAYDTPSNTLGNWIDIIHHHPTAITTNLLKHIATREKSDLKLILKIVGHNEANQEVIVEIIGSPLFSHELAQAIQKKLSTSQDLVVWNTFITKLFEQLSKAPDYMLPGWRNLLTKAVQTILEIPSNDALLDFIRRNTDQISDNLCYTLIDTLGAQKYALLPLKRMLHTQDEALIETFFKREDISEDLLHQLFFQALPYSSFKKILEHPLSQPHLHQWCEEINTEKNRLSHDLSPEGKLCATLTGLKVKAIQHSIKAKNNNTYNNAAASAFTLYHSLNQAFANYQLNHDSVVFKTRSEEAINLASPTLSIHRGYKQVLLDLLNAILAIVSVYKLFSKEWRFFKANTDSMTIVEGFREQLPLPDPK